MEKLTFARFIQQNIFNCLVLTCFFIIFLFFLTFFYYFYNLPMKNRINNNNYIHINRSKSPNLQSHLHNQKNQDMQFVLAQIQLQKHKSQDYKHKILQRTSMNQKKNHQNIHQLKDTQSKTVNVSSSQQGINNRIKEDDDNTTEQSSSQYICYGVGDYQLDSYDMLNKKKNVKFQEKVLELQKNEKKLRGSDKSSSRNSSILKNTVRMLDRSLANSSEKSVSIQNSFTAVKKARINLVSPEISQNLTIKNKYQSIIRSLEERSKGKMEIKQKYIDDRFPPVQSSLFSNSIHKKNTISRGKQQFFWMRISEIFQGKNIKVFSKTKKSDNLIISGCKNYVQPYLTQSFNAINHNVSLLTNIFENEQINKFGVYFIKIYQENSWKYIILDDLIPCVKKRHRTKKQQRYEPIFIDVLAPEGQIIYIWPFLLEKAYSNYYGYYENLCFGNTVDFMSEITGTSFINYSLNDKKKSKSQIQKQIFTISKEINDQKNIIIGYKQQKNAFYHLFPSKNNFLNEDIYLQYKDPQKNHQKIKVKLQMFPSEFPSIYLYKFNFYEHIINCPIYPPKFLKDKIKAQKTKEDFKFIQIPANDTISIRTFTLLKGTHISLSIKQKEMRFYYQCGLTEYIWIRGILAQKEYDGGLRWISGRYSNEKQIVFDEYLEPGDYYLIVMVQWRSKNSKEITITLYSNCQFLKFQRKNYNKKEKIIQQCCMDLAQRFGKLSQINKSICAYKYLCQQAAIIIQNINNQRTKGDVTIMRSFNGLRSKVEILPINYEFQKEIPEEYGSLEKENRTVIGYSTEIDINKGESFTVVLRMRGGIDRKFFKIFNFG